MESPAGVGFSYSTDPKSDYMIDDSQTALDNYGVLVSFFRAYSEYKQNEFYIAYVKHSPHKKSLCTMRPCNLYNTPPSCYTL